MILVSLFAAVMCIFAPFTVPFGPVPLSLSTFALYLTAIILGKKAVISIIVYIQSYIRHLNVRMETGLTQNGCLEMLTVIIRL